MRTFYIFTLLLYACAVPLGPVIDLGYTVYLGNDTLPDVHFFGGIHYARSPLSDLRFRAPQPLNEGVARASTDIVDARNWGPLCIQQPAVVGIGSEGLVLFTTRERL